MAKNKRHHGKMQTGCRNCRGLVEENVRKEKSEEEDKSKRANVRETEEREMG